MKIMCYDLLLLMLSLVWLVWIRSYSLSSKKKKCYYSFITEQTDVSFGFTLFCDVFTRTPESNPAPPSPSPFFNPLWCCFYNKTLVSSNDFPRYVEWVRMTARYCSVSSQLLGVKAQCFLSPFKTLKRVFTCWPNFKREFSNGFLRKKNGTMASNH